MTNKFRASYSILALWASGNWQRAIEQYFKLGDFVTPAMAEGRKYHKKWAEYIKVSKKLPLEFGGGELKNPMVEQKRVVSINEWLDLVYVMDCYDEPVLYDWKTGKQSSESYTSNMQMPLYALGATYDKLLVKKAEIHHYDQYSKKTDMSVLWITDKKLEEAYNWLVTLGGEIHNYLLTNKLYERFNGSRDWGGTNDDED